MDDKKDNSAASDGDGSSQLNLGNYTWPAGNSVGGMIPTKIHQLNLLSVFDAGENQLTGPLPSGIFVSMTSLRQLRLDKNDLSGTTSPPIVLSELEQLELQNNELIGEIPALPRTLTFCNLSSNMLQVVNASVCEV
ncbi:unnamed protein product [Cylindrotheca closterium]|uniref:Uncharacterized protein n=1 Tax=Cylindrotheca closterium TaxID=2856 RepID=A0AAD2FWG0_9STRA|nr:unnamed protein product [Cylindrotheca closterium]